MTSKSEIVAKKCFLLTIMKYMSRMAISVKIYRLLLPFVWDRCRS